jgi:predicted ABC-type ATPase
MPTLTVIAGANGSGKSTLTKQLERPILLIDPDAIAKEINQLDPASAAIAAGRQALALSQQYIQSESSHSESPASTPLMSTTARQNPPASSLLLLIGVCLTD